MDYEQKYKNALEWARGIYHNAVGADKEDLEHYFPELKESEDEKIRKEIIDFLWKEKIFLQEAHLSVENSPKYRFVIDAIAWLEKQGQKFETKFHVWDWILYSGDHYEGARHITRIDKDGYYIERNGLPHGIIPFNHEIHMRLWAINDAKEGDVLISNDEVFIFAHRKQLYPIAVAHCFVDSEGGFHLEGEFGYSKEEGHSIHPATKEQRDTLFTKMKDAGYIWDADKKELLKEEVSSTDDLI